MVLPMASLRAVNEKYMVDECQIFEDPEGHADDLWDDDLGEYTFVPDDKTLKYQGKCMIYEDSSPLTDENSGPSQQFLRYWLEVPYTVVDVPENALVTVTVSQDPELVGKNFLVRALTDDSFATSRRIRMSRRVLRPRT